MDFLATPTASEDLERPVCQPPRTPGGLVAGARALRWPHSRASQVIPLFPGRCGGSCRPPRSTGPAPPPDRGPVCTSRCCPLHPPSPVCPVTEPRRLPLPEMPVALPLSRTLVTAGDVKRFCLRAAATLSVTIGDGSPAARGDVPAQPPHTQVRQGQAETGSAPPSCRELGERESGRNGTVCLRPVVASRGGPDRAECSQRLSQGPGPEHAAAFVQKPPAGALGDSGAQGVQIGAQECRRVCQRSE